MKEKTVIDGKNATLGRLASYVAKKSLMGKELVVVNCDETVIVGKPSTIINEYREMKQKGGAAMKGPFFPKSPERIVKRTVRGMLSYKQGRGREAFKRIKCYNGTPEEFADIKKIIAGKKKRTKTLKLKELSNNL